MRKPRASSETRTLTGWGDDTRSGAGCRVPGAGRRALGATIPAVTNAQVAARCAFACAVLFVALIVAFSSLGGGAPSGPMLLAIGVIGVASHVVLLPVVAALSAPEW